MHSKTEDLQEEKLTGKIDKAIRLTAKHMYESLFGDARGGMMSIRSLQRCKDAKGGGVGVEMVANGAKLGLR
jgi:hypothetical protein